MKVSADKLAVEELTGKLANLFAILAIVISSLGLFGLSAFAAEQRTKEVGIRKVLGTTLTGIVSLFQRSQQDCRNCIRACRTTSVVDYKSMAATVYLTEWKSNGG